MFIVFCLSSSFLKWIFFPIQILFKYRRMCNYEDIHGFDATCFTLCWCVLIWLSEKLRMEGLKQSPDAEVLGNSLHISVLVSSSSMSCKRNPHDHVKISATITSFYQHQFLFITWKEVKGWRHPKPPPNDPKVLQLVVS